MVPYAGMNLILRAQGFMGCLLWALCTRANFTLSVQLCLDLAQINTTLWGQVSICSAPTDEVRFSEEPGFPVGP